MNKKPVPIILFKHYLMLRWFEIPGIHKFEYFNYNEGHIRLVSPGNYMPCTIRNTHLFVNFSIEHSTSFYLSNYNIESYKIMEELAFSADIHRRRFQLD